MTWTQHSRAELRADLLVHLAGLAFAVVAGPVLVVLAWLRADGATVAAVTVYAMTLIAMLGASAAYHLSRHPRWRAALRRLDHGAIYLKIAGTYTPFAAISMSAGAGPGLLTTVWSVAGAGLALKLFAPMRFERLSVALYLALGWAGVWVWSEMAAALSPQGLILLGAGGALYSVGVGFFLWEKLPFNNAIWHLHVLVASVCMFAAVAVEMV